MTIREANVAAALEVMTRFAVDPEGVLMTSPKSEVGKCDTDIQTLGAPTERAHAALPREMMRL